MIPTIESAAVVPFLTDLAWFVFIVIVGYFAAIILATFTKKLYRKSLKPVMEEEGLETAFLGMKVEDMIYGIVKISVILLVLGEAFKFLSIQSALDVVNNVLSIVWSIVIGVSVIVIGYLLAHFIEKKTREAYVKSGVKGYMKQKGYEDALLGFDMEHIVALSVKWLVFILFLIQGLQLIPYTSELYNFVRYVVYPLYLDVLRAVIVLAVAALLVEYINNKTKETRADKRLVTVAGVIIYFLALMTALSVLGIKGVGYILELFKYFVIAAAVGLGLGLAIALGWGGKDVMSEILRDLKEKYWKG